MLVVPASSLQCHSCCQQLWNQAVISSIRHAAYGFWPQAVMSSIRLNSFTHWPRAGNAFGHNQSCRAAGTMNFDPPALCCLWFLEPSSHVEHQAQCFHTLASCWQSFGPKQACRAAGTMNFDPPASCCLWFLDPSSHVERQAQLIFTHWPCAGNVFGSKQSCRGAGAMNFDPHAGHLEPHLVPPPNQPTVPGYKNSVSYSVYPRKSVCEYSFLEGKAMDTPYIQP